jgi:hypothetical protein
MVDQEDKISQTASDNSFEQLRLFVDADLYRAFQRCVWIIINETGRNQIDIMNEMIRDFLIKHKC